MAARSRFELEHARVKVVCLTAWLPGNQWRLVQDSNLRPNGYQPCALPTELTRQMVTSMGFEPMNAAVKGQCVKPLHQLAKTVVAQLLGHGIKSRFFYFVFNHFIGRRR